MDVNSKIKQYNDLVDAWEDGSEWVANNELTVVQEAKALKRFKEIIYEADKLYSQLKAYGVEVKAFNKIHNYKEKS